ncbi:MAG: phosphotransferase family protein [Rhodobacteraceae bacterium]|nr:phosphotransferase family protein [Paracoccaceae bacterium]
MDIATQQKIADALAARTGAQSARVLECRLLTGGAIQQNWLFDLDFTGGSHAGRLNTVLRTNSASVLDVSLSRAQEFSLFQIAWEAGIKVPEPLWFLDSGTAMERPLFVMRRLVGTAAGHRLVRALPQGSPSLARDLGAELARIHSVRPPVVALGFLLEPGAAPALDEVRALRAALDAIRAPQPVVEWGIRWLEINAPGTETIVLCHNDYRTGNYMVDGEILTGILDWEFAAWGDPMQDIGWFTARCWRFGSDARVAGGIGALGDFMTGYVDVSGQSPDLANLRYWQVMATLRWAVIALAQGERHLSGTEPSLELALTRQIVPELEHDILTLTQEVPHARSA